MRPMDVTTPVGRSPFEAVRDEQGATILDEGLATSLEALGYDIGDDLWSVKILLENPDAVRGVHTDFLLAGADCITSNTYQASIPGLVALELTYDGAVEVLRRVVSLAVEAPDAFWSHAENRD
jgi:homocysteine S-methyltransferase